MSGAACCLCLLGTLSLIGAMPAESARAEVARVEQRSAGADAARAAAPRAAAAAPARSPDAPPLDTSSGPGDEEGASGGATVELDPLVGNGLDSPVCPGTAASAQASADATRNCETSGFPAASAPTGDYGIDVHIDTGVLGLSEGGLLSTVQDLVIAPVWMALVWSVHALVVMLEWAFAIDLLESSSAAGLGSQLQHVQSAFTAPWLELALAVAAALCAYDGLVRRRIAESLGQALTMLAMMAAGLWVIADPAATIGALAAWANQASLGALAVASRGEPGSPGAALSEDLGGVFATAVEGPWCYMEFGDVAWCRARPERRLQRAGVDIAGLELALAACKPEPVHLLPCADGSAQARVLGDSARLLRGAETNGALFLALPANGWARNSITDSDSLLRVLCGSSQATACRGPTAAQAEFRANAGTWPRLGGLILIAIGGAGMLLLFGFITLRLLVAALLSLLLLLLAPAVVLMPAFGEGGRELFRGWGARLLGAVASKLVFAFLLGVVLAGAGVVARLPALGWWTQWLLMSAFWWMAFIHRGHALGVTHGALHPQGGPRPKVPWRPERALRRSLAVGSQATLGGPAAALKRRRRKRQGVGGPPDRDERPERSPAPRREPPEPELRGQARRMFEHDHRDACATLARAPRTRERLAERRTQLARVRRESALALSRGERRRHLRLEHRALRIEGEMAAAEAGVLTARSILRRSGTPKAAGGEPRADASEIERREQLLDREAAIVRSAGSRGRAPAGRRDYEALAGLAGRTRSEYRRLDPASQRRARLEIDRELDVRRQLSSRTGDLTASPRPRVERRAAEPGADARGGRERGRRAGGAEPGSRVIEDARAVAEGRKRQLGLGRP